MRELDPLLHSQLRLAIVSLLLSVETADFVYLNLSVQLEKLETAGYIQVKKEFVGKKTRTSCQLTDTGRKALEDYIDALREYLNL